MAVTIKDVAKVAKVNPSTVSRVIADNPRISDKTKKAVREAMMQLGYHPNLNARSLVSKNTNAIGIIMPSSPEKGFQNPFFSEVLGGISNLAHHKQYSLYMSTGETASEMYSAVVNMVQGRRVDGIILLYSRVDDKIVDYLKKQEFPFVIVGKPYREQKKIAYVDNDNFAATKEITTHFINSGHKKIGFIGGSLDLVVTVDRLNGYKKALEKVDIAINTDYIIHKEFNKESGKEAIIELMSLAEPPTALVVTDDLISFGVLSALREMGINVPSDISIISFNNIMLTEFSVPPLSSIDINIYQLGYHATKLLIGLIQKSEEIKEIIIPHKLVLRESCLAQVSGVRSQMTE